MFWKYLKQKISNPKNHFSQIELPAFILRIALFPFTTWYLCVFDLQTNILGGKSSFAQLVHLPEISLYQTNV